ncbi:MAG: regulatory protein GemA [Alphaproteobacteria bacterium]|nr:regulatory protein GemA [Alphaproteobacteria bacterium]
MVAVMPVDRKQLSLIHVAKTRLGMEDADYRALLKRMGGVDSAKNLDLAGFQRMMDAFSRLGFHSDFAERNFGSRVGMASARQVAMIRTLWGRFTGGEGDDASLGKWLEKKFKISSVRFITREAAQKVIAALLAMCERVGK